MAKSKLNAVSGSCHIAGDVYGSPAMLVEFGWPKLATGRLDG